jgi:hypothetical protein
VPDTRSSTSPARPGATPLLAPARWTALVRSLRTAGLAWSLLLVAAATLTPRGSGWRWGDPLTELRWYATGLASPGTLVQLVGNLALLALPAAFAAQLWPRMSRLPVLAPVAVLAGTSIEVLQRLLPIGRVVSPVDALLNATGAVLTAVLGTRMPRRRAARVRALLLQQ